MSEPPLVKVGTPVDERAALLESQTQHDPNYTNPESTTDDEDEHEEPEATKRGWGELTFYGVCAVVAIVLLVLLVKGFIDKGDLNFDFKKALKSALGGGLSGAAAMVLQVLTLMPLRTTMNYQYRYGTSLTRAISTLYSQGFRRFYAGLLPALIQGPISRFGDTASNVGILALLNSNEYTRTLPEWVKTGFTAVVAAGFRMVLTPVDTVKTTMQTQGGKEGLGILKRRIKRHGIGTLWYGALGTAAATFVGYYPWFGTYNYLDANLPQPDPDLLYQKLLRRALTGFVASVVSDTTSEQDENKLLERGQGGYKAGWGTGPTGEGIEDEDIGERVAGFDVFGALEDVPGFMGGQDGLDFNSARIGLILVGTTGLRERVDYILKVFFVAGSVGQVGGAAGISAVLLSLKLGLFSPLSEMPH
ncbi:hypothetical protein V5O48_010025 [Marasmius crinis-equi]|uniref:Mitochondrial carrier n=1 Tax=Marasmius crinis-equi TaxID=585013 RepID=A0ABR3F9M2_9AGAR